MSRMPIDLDKAEVERLYWEERLTIAEVAKRMYCSEKALHRFMVWYGIPRREKGIKNPKKHKVGNEMLTVKQIAEKYGQKRSTIQNRVHRGFVDMDIVTGRRRK